MNGDGRRARALRAALARGRGSVGGRGDPARQGVDGSASDASASRRRGAAGVRRSSRRLRAGRPSWRRPSCGRLRRLGRRPLAAASAAGSGACRQRSWLVARRRTAFLGGGLCGGVAGGRVAGRLVVEHRFSGLGRRVTLPRRPDGVGPVPAGWPTPGKVWCAALETDRRRLPHPGRRPVALPRLLRLGSGRVRAGRRPRRSRSVAPARTGLPREAPAVRGRPQSGVRKGRHRVVQQASRAVRPR